MWRYILRRILLLIPVVLGVAILVFVIMDACPGDAADIIAGSTATEEVVEQLREKLGDALDSIAVFHLRGSIRWQSLGLAERLMMKALLMDMKKKPEAQRSETERLLIETEGGALDFADEADIASIVHAARFGREAE